MGWLKREFIVQAYEEIGLASYVLGLQPEQLQSALRKLDMMMASWNAKGIRLGYPIPETAGGSSLAEDSGVPDRANEAIYTNLAIRLANAIGRPVSPELRTVARESFHVLLMAAAMPDEMQMPSGMPVGAGYKSTEQKFFEPEEDLEVGGDSDLEL